jgi:ankyrin repeat protein
MTSSDSEPPSPDSVETLLRAARDNHTITIGFWVNLWGAHIDSAGRDGTTALMEAAYAGHASAARLLVERGASVKARNKLGDGVMMRAVKGGRAEMVRLLIELDAPLADEDASGMRPLALAQKNGQQEIVRLLQEALEQAGETAYRAFMEGSSRTFVAMKPLVKKGTGDIPVDANPGACDGAADEEQTRNRR